MAERAATAEVAALKRPFIVGLVLVLAAMVAIGVVIHQANAGNDRPEGAAERWLAAVGDTTRSGVGGDAEDRADELGGIGPAATLLAGAETDGEAAFPDLEVGKARRRSAGLPAPTTEGPAAGAIPTDAESLTGVPFRLHVRTAAGEELREGQVILAEEDGGWRVIGVDPTPGRVPSQGGEPPSRAPLGAFVGAILLGVLVAAGCAGLIRWAGPEAPEAAR